MHASMRRQCGSPQGMKVSWNNKRDSKGGAGIALAVRLRAPAPRLLGLPGFILLMPSALHALCACGAGPGWVCLSPLLEICPLRRHLQTYPPCIVPSSAVHPARGWDAARAHVGERLTGEACALSAQRWGIGQGCVLLVGGRLIRRLCGFLSLPQPSQALLVSYSML